MRNQHKETPLSFQLRELDAVEEVFVDVQPDPLPTGGLSKKDCNMSAEAL